MIVDCASSERLVGSTASEFLATQRAHDILLDTGGFRYVESQHGTWTLMLC